MNLDRLEDPNCCFLPPVSLRGISATLSPPFEPTWHPFYAERLAVFPRSVLLHDSEQGISSSCWPDFATLTEDEDERQMAYYPVEPSARSLLAAFDKRSGQLHVCVYEDDRILLRASVSNATNRETATVTNRL